MELEFAVRGESLMVAVAGDLDLLTADVFRRRVEAAMERTGTRHLFVDLSRMAFIDSSGIGALLGRYRRTQHTGGRMALVGATAAVRQTLLTAGLSRLLDEPGGCSGDGVAG